MKLESVGILIELRPFGERDAIARIFTRDHGILIGMMKGAAVARKNKPLVGQVGNVSWNARLDSQLGVFHFESSHNLVAPLMNDAQALSFVNSMFALLSTLLPEREKYETLWNQTEAALSAMLGSRVPPILGGAVRCSLTGGGFEIKTFEESPPSSPTATLPPKRGETRLPNDRLKHYHEALCTQCAQSFAKTLRKEMTKHEAILWKNLRKSPCGFDFVKQFPIDKYIVDFINRKTNLIIELDGSGHSEEQQIYHDAVRDKFLQDSGYRIIRFWNDSIIKNIGGVLDIIYHYLTHESEIPTLQWFYPRKIIDKSNFGELHLPPFGGECRRIVGDEGGLNTKSANRAPPSQATPDSPPQEGWHATPREIYLNWEINLLRELGYALDLTRCSGCGAVENLTHISPRTARAVCSECAAPYLTQLFTLPVDLETTGKFLSKIMNEHSGKELPLARKIICK